MAELTGKRQSAISARAAGKNAMPNPVAEPRAGLSSGQFSDWFRLMLSAVTHEVGNSLQVYRLLSIMRNGEGSALVDDITHEYSRICLLGSYLKAEPGQKTVQDLRSHWPESQFDIEDAPDMRILKVKALCPQHISAFRSLLDETERILGDTEGMSSDVRFHFLRVQKYGRLLCDALSGLLRDDLESVVSVAPQRLVGKSSIAMACVQIANERSCSLVIAGIEPSLYGSYAASNPLFLRLIISNIFMNAHNAYNGSRGQCTISLAASRSGEMVRLAFTDNGRGMDPDTMGKLNSGIRTTTDDSPGHGAGFPYCRELAERLGGRLYVEHSEPGNGSTVVLELRGLAPATAYLSSERS